MGTGTRPTRTTPYAVVVVFKARGQAPAETPQSYHKRLGDALKLAYDSELAWVRLIGNQFSPLHWIVIDTRDYSRHHPFHLLAQGGHHGNTRKAHDRPHS